MMEPFLVSAPGKVIVFGEHSVVHGRPAIAAAISLRSYLLVTPSHDPSGPITLDFPDIGLHHSWDSSSLPWSAFTTTSAELARPTFKNKDAHLSALQPHSDIVSPASPPTVRRLHETAAQGFLFTLLGISAGTPIPACTFTMRSAIPISAGMGSSASTAVCVTTAALILACHLPTPSSNSAPATTTASLALIRHWSLAGELCAHANPSGIDNAVATNGAAVRFKRAADGTSAFDTLHNFPKLGMLLIDTCQSRSTKVEVQKVQALLDTYPALTNGVMDGIEEVADEAIKLFGQEHGADLIPKLGALMRINHGLLVALGVSHPRIERVRQLVDEAGLGWTKLTGAGGGGCTITLLNEAEMAGAVAGGHVGGGYAERLKSLTEKLDGEGFKEYTATLGARGVAVLLSSKEGKVPVPASKDFLSLSVEDLDKETGNGIEENGWAYWQ